MYQSTLHQVLSDTSTLSELGLDHNCVVHCLVHQPRNPVNPPEASSSNVRENHINQHNSFFTGFHRHDDPMAQFQQQGGTAAAGNFQIKGY